MAVQRVAIFGAGQMGSGIAQVFAQAGLDVVLVDVEQRLVDKGLKAVTGNLARAVEKGRMTAEAMDAALTRIKGTTKPPESAPCDLVIEAILEEKKLKRDLFHELDAILPAEVVFASNTSSISITELAAATKRPDRFVGMHFFHPVPVMKLVEVIRGARTSDATVQVVLGLCERLGKTPLAVHDYPGFVSNRILMPYVNEAIWALHEGVATREAIDGIARLGFNHPMGPLELADFIGLDTCLQILEVLLDGFKDPKYRPCPLLRRMVHAGHLGRKTGKGFYDYPAS